MMAHQFALNSVMVYGYEISVLIANFKYFLTHKLVYIIFLEASIIDDICGNHIFA